MLYILFKTEQKATGLIKYEHKTFVDSLKVVRPQWHISDREQRFQQSTKLGARVADWVRSLDLTAHTSLSPICKLQKGCTRLAAASDKVYQLLAQGRWFSPGTTASSTTKTGRHDIAEILLKVALSTKIQIQIYQTYNICKYRLVWFV